EGPLKAATMEETVKLWSDQDIEAPGSWLNQLPRGAGRDSAVGGYVSKLTPQFPEFAVEWAQIITDPKLRAQQLEKVAEPHMQSDASAARSGVAQSELHEAEKTGLLSRSVVQQDR